MSDFEKQAVNLKLSLAIDTDLTWGELFQFVELARRSGADPANRVPLEYDERDDAILNGLAVYLAPEDLTDTSQSTT